MEPSPSNDPDPLREFLASRDAPCPGCGYNLRGLTGDRCPECNEELRLQVGLVEPKLASFLTGLIGLACGAGFFGIVLFFNCVQFLTSPYGGAGGRFFLIIIAGMVIEGVAIVVWLRMRSRSRGLGRSARVALASGCWMLTAGLAMLAFIFTR